MAEQDARNRLLTAAGPIFAARGYEKATIREICRQAGVNVASVGYYFGDKFGLYREVIQQIREVRVRQYPDPPADVTDPKRGLLAIVRTMLARTCAPDADWESQILAREMQQPTPVFADIIEEFFRPMFERLMRTLQELIGRPVPRPVLQRLAFSVVGQCFFYRAGRGMFTVLVDSADQERHFDLDTLARHITAVMLSAVENSDLEQQTAALTNLNATRMAHGAHAQTGDTQTEQETKSAHEEPAANDLAILDRGVNRSKLRQPLSSEATTDSSNDTRTTITGNRSKDPRP